MMALWVGDVIADSTQNGLRSSCRVSPSKAEAS